MIEKILECNPDKLLIIYNGLIHVSNVPNGDFTKTEVYPLCKKYIEMGTAYPVIGRIGSGAYYLYAGISSEEVHTMLALGGVEDKFLVMSAADWKEYRDKCTMDTFEKAAARFVVNMRLDGI